MNLDLELKLKKDYPLLYAHLHESTSCKYPCTVESLGIANGNGWFYIIEEVSAKLEKEIQKEPEQKRIQYAAVQIKEKFGTLRLYQTHATPAMSKLVGEAMKKSEQCCEVCGKSAILRCNEFNWFSTRCDKHYNSLVHKE